MDVSDLGAVLAGMAPALLDGEKAEGIVSLFYSTEEVPQVQDCWVQITCPGFRDMRIDGAAQFLAYGPSEYEVEVVPTVSGFGSIELVPTGMEKAQASWIGGAFLLLSLTDVSSRQQLSLGAHLDLVTGSTVYDVPAGVYQWAAKGREGLWKCADDGESVPLVVVEDEVSRLEIDMALTCSLVIRPVLASGETYGGPLSLGIARGVPIIEPNGQRRMNGGYVHSRERGPYLLPLLSPGEYTLKGMGPKWSLPSDNGWLTLKLAAGQTLEVEIALDQ